MHENESVVMNFKITIDLHNPCPTCTFFQKNYNSCIWFDTTFFFSLCAFAYSMPTNALGKYINYAVYSYLLKMFTTWYVFFLLPGHL